MLESDTFESMNKIPLRDQVFDDVSFLRRDLGDILRALCRCLGPMTVLPLLSQQLNKLTSNLQAGNLNETQ